MQVLSYKDLLVWQKSMILVPKIYNISRMLPPSERYGLKSQIERAAVSIPSNIAEGTKRSTRVDFRQFCLIALGSSAELETQLSIIQNIYPEVEVNTVLGQITEIQKMLNGLINRLKPELSTKN